ncbi:PepSY-associated TM helix domain-containing protein [Aliiruegeria sabulilitoris]|uniref:PepSY-associated TM helix domain-containing protein n=1 Tax=Aliiruegeria sabulilitoris TaxID=1510458 RepID=UPI0008337FA9|nr:PepSY-associated TM helix domain-containing protein [Aliiruegeria sabulilitoris]NDR56202.1 PepSY domain-containing protein [Pseudoruegeria sp. M32A2M]
MSFRKILFWSHLVAGIGAGLVILMLAITGVLLTYEVQITRWAESGLNVSAAGEPLPADRLAEAALIETGGAASALIFENDAQAAVIAASGRSDKAFLDPYTGELLASNKTATQEFFATVTSLHRWLSFSGRSETGAALVGAANLFFGFLLLSGAYLWLPRIWKWGMLKTKMLFRRSYPNAKARDFAWHHVFGFWAAIPLFLIILSGVVISYDWASNLVFAAYGEQPAMRGASGGQGQGQGKGGGRGLGMGRLGGGGGHEDHESEGGALALAPGSLALQAVLETAEAYDPDWNRITLDLPKHAGATETTAIVDTGTGKQLSRQETLTVSLETGEVVKTAGLADRSPGAQARMWLRFVHTGEVYGVIGQTIAGLASLASVFMVYTGLALSYRRLIQPLFRRRKAVT